MRPLFPVKDTADAEEVSTLPTLQRLLEKMETQAGRVVANEAYCAVEQGGFSALDQVGRERLRNVCRDFHAQCQQTSAEAEARALLWRVQAIVTGKVEQPDGHAPPEAPAEAAAQPPPQQRPAQLRVPTTATAKTWWDHTYWTIARPTDFCYGDCAWGNYNQPQALSVIEWITALLRREELEYSLEDDAEPYEAAKVNRFRCSWQVLHLLHSFWRVTETTQSVHTALKTPGTFAFAQRMQQLTPDMIQQAVLLLQEKGKKATMQGLLSDKDVPELLRTALSSMQRCTSGVIGSNGHRKLLHREGVAYTLRFGPPLVFLTPNLADTKQPLLLVVQGEEFRFGDDEADFSHPYREMVSRLARDPVGQTLVFELMTRLFFVHVLGIRPDVVGWRRGKARTATGARYFDGAAADFYEDSIVGCVAAAFGAVEAQGRGSLHPHILVWLVLTSMQDGGHHYCALLTVFRWLEAAARWARRSHVFRPHFVISARSPLGLADLQTNVFRRAMRRTQRLLLLATPSLPLRATPCHSLLLPATHHPLLPVTTPYWLLLSRTCWAR